MKFFVYEFVTGGGWWTIDEGSIAAGALLREGSAMLQALVNDLSRIGKVYTLRDSRSTVEISSAEVCTVSSAIEERRQFAELVQNADGTVVIAPEFDGHLLARCQWVEQLGGRLLSPGSEFVAITADKHLTAKRLAAVGIPVPRGFIISNDASPPADFRFPAILKPCDGAGSIGVRTVRDWREAREDIGKHGRCRLEEYRCGIPASVSVLSGPQTLGILPASRQFLSDDGRFQYLGGETPMSDEMCRRSKRLAIDVAFALPDTAGYFGIDLVFGAAADGSQDCVIEVNPRLTTSYLGLRQLLEGNLAEAMVAVAKGKLVDLRFRTSPVQFSACNGLE
jgi:predicted ATP-grasp superfamily ATP-dependent carboligase